MTEYLIARLRLDTYRRILKIFPAMNGESMASYFSRLSHWMQEIQ